MFMITCYSLSMLSTHTLPTTHTCEQRGASSCGLLSTLIVAMSYRYTYTHKIANKPSFAEIPVSLEQA